MKENSRILQRDRNRGSSLWMMVLLFICLLSSMNCDSNHAETFNEGPVEIVNNRVKPDRAKRGENRVILKELFYIDAENPDLMSSGMGAMGEFTIDSKGNFYIISLKGGENFIYKLDRRGAYLGSFGRKGQGPGELELPDNPTVIGDRIGITDFMKKYVIYDLNGNLLKEIIFCQPILSADMLSNGRFLVFWSKKGVKTPHYGVKTLSLFDHDFKEIRELEDYKLYYQDNKLTPFFMWRTTERNVFVINEERGYEISVYDLEGKLRRKIRKEYLRVSPDDDIREAILGRDARNAGNHKPGYIPDPMPPMRYFMVDENGRMFVMTYERGMRPGEYIYDVFDGHGSFISRKPLKISWAGDYFGPKKQLLTKDRIMFYRESASGFQQLVVYKLIWG